MQRAKLAIEVDKEMEIDKQHNEQRVFLCQLPTRESFQKMSYQ